MANVHVQGIQALKSWVELARAYERHLSAVSLIAGYTFDNFTFGRIDRPMTHVVFVAYLLVAGISIAVLHTLESRSEEKRPSPRTRAILTSLTQFALGCLLSGFCVFYLRSASFWGSWPYLLALAAIFAGNEFLKKYHARLTFASLLFFFSLLSYAMLVVPVLTARMGTLPFLLSGVVAVLIFAIFLFVLGKLGKDRYRQARLRIAGGALGIFAAVNGFYFARILPPLPLALADVGVFHDAKRVGNLYQVMAEQEPWPVRWGFPPVLHLAPGERLYLYSAVFAPVRLTTTIVDRWEWFNPESRSWTAQSTVSYPVKGGRADGYRGYTIKSKPRAGDWRVEITTADGRPLGRVRFSVIATDSPVPLASRLLN